MRAITLLYHDVIPPGSPDESGFPGGDAWIYKLELTEFQQHLNAIRAVVSKCFTVHGLGNSSCPTLLTFDDGGSSAHHYIADALEARGWRGHFFITTNWIGRSGFLKPAQIRDLRRRGHLIGTHSCSHPVRMSYCTHAQLRQEWNDSVVALSQILGEPIRIASVPGGYYGQNVAQTAAEAGIRFLFTSEPTSTTHTVDDCLVLGRYTIQHGVAACTAAAIASGKFAPRHQQLIHWNMKKIAKTAGGTAWLRMRKWLLAGNP